MSDFLFGRRFNHVDTFTIGFTVFLINDGAVWLMCLSFSIAGFSLSYFGERHLKGTL